MDTHESRPSLPSGVVWSQRSFPDANFLLLRGEQTALVDSGFVAHAEQTQALALEHGDEVSWVVNTHWHSDHVGANALLQQAGARIAAAHHDADALERADPGCCMAEYLDQPVPQYAVDLALADGDRLLLGDSEWEIVAVPGHTPGHVALWDPDHRLAAVGDAVSSYDVGWVDVMREGVQAIDASLASLERLRELDARLFLPGHGPLVTDPGAAVEKAIKRLQRQRADLDVAVDYGAKRILAFALMIRGGMTPDALDAYLATRAWAARASATVGQRVEDFARDLVDAMLASGALVLRNGTVRAAADSTPVDPAVFDLPFPRHWLESSEPS